MLGGDGYRFPIDDHEVSTCEVQVVGVLCWQPLVQVFEVAAQERRVVVVTWFVRTQAIGGAGFVRHLPDTPQAGSGKMRGLPIAARSQVAA